MFSKTAHNKEVPRYKKKMRLNSYANIKSRKHTRFLRAEFSIIESEERIYTVSLTAETVKGEKSKWNDKEVLFWKSR